MSKPNRGQTRGQTERFPMIQPGADILTNINTNGGGQECPPHTGGGDARASGSVMVRST
jgi:hypothetical protein